MTVNKESNKIWSEIRNLDLGLFALPNQTVEKHVVPLEVSGEELYLKLNSSAVLPALEDVLGRAFDLIQAEGYIIVRRASDKDAQVKQALREQKDAMRGRAEAAVMKK